MANFLEWARGVSPSNLAADLNNFVRVNVVDRIDHRSESFAQQMTEWMQANAVWEDRTGEARATLHVTVERAGTMFIFTLEHGVEYGIFLETMQAGAFSILTPALAYFGPQTTDLVKAGQ